MHLFDSLPDYARPIFLRVRNDLEVTGTFKHTKSALVRDGYDPVATTDPIYFHDRERQAFVRLDKSLYDRIQSSGIRPYPMAISDLRHVVTQLASDMADGPIVPTVAPEEIRSYLGSRYDFTKPMALDDVTADVERMMRTWHVQVTHPRYFGLFNPSVSLASVIADTLVAMYKPPLAAWRTSPAANENEPPT